MRPLFVVHDGREAEAARANSKFGEAELLHDNRQNGYTHQDNVRPVGRQSNQRFSFGQGQVPEMFLSPPNFVLG